MERPSLETPSPPVASPSQLLDNGHVLPAVASASCAVL